MAQVSSPPGLPAQAGTSTPVLKQYVHVPETKHERMLSAKTGGSLCINFW